MAARAGRVAGQIDLQTRLAVPHHQPVMARKAGRATGAKRRSEALVAVTSSSKTAVATDPFEVTVQREKPSKSPLSLACSTPSGASRRSWVERKTSLPPRPLRAAACLRPLEDEEHLLVRRQRPEVVGDQA